jgi:hypothetical protein
MIRYAGERAGSPGTVRARTRSHNQEEGVTTVTDDPTTDYRKAGDERLDEAAEGSRHKTGPGSWARLDRNDRDDTAASLRTLRRAFPGRRPPLTTPLTDNALASGTMAVLELRARLKPLGENEQQRSASEISREVINAAAPFIQRDLLSRVVADRLWMTGWALLGPFVAVAALGTGAVYAAVNEVTWLLILLISAAVVTSFGAMQVTSAVRRQTGRALSLLERPLTGPPPAEDESASTMDIFTADNRKATK